MSFNSILLPKQVLKTDFWHLMGSPLSSVLAEACSMQDLENKAVTNNNNIKTWDVLATVKKDKIDNI